MFFKKTCCSKAHLPLPHSARKSFEHTKRQIMICSILASFIFYSSQITWLKFWYTGKVLETESQDCVAFYLHLADAPPASNGLFRLFWALSNPQTALHAATKRRKDCLRNKLNDPLSQQTQRDKLNATIPCLTRHVTARDSLYGSQLKARGGRRLGLPASGGAPLRGGGMKLKSDGHREI